MSHDQISQTLLSALYVKVKPGNEANKANRYQCAGFTTVYRVVSSKNSQRLASVHKIGPLTTTSCLCHQEPGQHGLSMPPMLSPSGISTHYNDHCTIGVSRIRSMIPTHALSQLYQSPLNLLAQGPRWTDNGPLLCTQTRLSTLLPPSHPYPPTHLEVARVDLVYDLQVSRENVLQHPHWPPLEGLREEGVVGVCKRPGKEGGGKLMEKEI